MALSATSIELHDDGLVGTVGARSVLTTLSANPAVQRVALSSNSLFDEGVTELSAGVTALRVQGRLAVGLVELNLCASASLALRRCSN